MGTIMDNMSQLIIYKNLIIGETILNNDALTHNLTIDFSFNQYYNNFYNHNYLIQCLPILEMIR